jgi:hypothetical protein
MKKRNKGISFVLIVLILAGITTAFVTVHGATIFDGTIDNSTDDPVVGASVILTDSLFNILGSDTTDGNGEYSISATLNGYSPYLISVVKTRYDNGYETVYSGGTYNIQLEWACHKVGVFFWASDAGVNTAINDYKGVLTDDEDYDKIFEWKDCTNVASKCQEVDNYERENDVIFVYIMGHGYNDGSHSYTDFAYGDNTTVVGSHTFKGYMDDWEASKKCILVESCKSGDWADDFDDTGYLAMSTADETHLAYTIDPAPDEGEFSFHFFYAVEVRGYNAEDAFDYACDEITETQNPKMEDNSAYDFFD